MAKKKLEGISHNFDGRKPEDVRVHGELVLREAFLRSTREELDNFGIEKYSVDKIRGMVDLLEMYTQVNDELE